MASTVLGMFANRNSAEGAITKLETAGYNPKDISIMMQDQAAAKDIAKNSGVGENVAGGAATGGVIGAIAGLLIGIGAIAIPGIGGLLIGGPIAVALGLGGAAATTVSGAFLGSKAAIGAVRYGLEQVMIPQHADLVKFDIIHVRGDQGLIGYRAR